MHLVQHELSGITNHMKMCIFQHVFTGTLWILCFLLCIEISRSTNKYVDYKCASYPTKIICGDDVEAIVLSAELCDETYMPEKLKCGNCIWPKRFREVFKTFSACNEVEGNFVKQKTNLKENVHPNRTAKIRARSKRQAEDVPRRRNCSVVDPPKPGKMSCTILSTAILCNGTCKDGYRFADGSLIQALECIEEDGFWQPRDNFQICEPQCNPKCQNGGICVDENICLCTNEYRGNLCQHPIVKCAITKTDSASAWECNHTNHETLCKISCHPPGTVEAAKHFSSHSCSVFGQWNPVLPPCVKAH